MPRLFSGLACIALSLLTTSTLAAQTPEIPSTTGDSVPYSSDTTRLSSDTLRLAGSRVRGVLADGARFVGVVRAVHGDTLVLREQSAPGTPRRLAATSLQRLEVQREGRSLTRNVQIGGYIGAAAGALVYLNFCDKHPGQCRTCQSDYYDDQQQDERLDLGSVMVLAGAVVGGAIGYVLTPPSWRRVGVSVSGAVAPGTDGGARASLGARLPLTLLATRH